MVVLYDGGDHSDAVLKATSWLEHSGKFNVSVLSINKKHDYDDDNNNNIQRSEDDLSHNIKQKEYLEQVGVEFNEIYLSEGTEQNSEKSADLILSAVNSSQPDLVIAGATIGKFSFFNNLHFLALLDQLNCPIVIAKDFTIPGMHRVKTWLMKVIRK
jgi:basic amino acid/polyamine antiporter, APA family